MNKNNGSVTSSSRISRLKYTNKITSNQNLYQLSGYNPPIFKSSFKNKSIPIRIRQNKHTSVSNIKTPVNSYSNSKTINKDDILFDTPSINVNIEISQTITLEKKTEIIYNNSNETDNTNSVIEQENDSDSDEENEPLPQIIYEQEQPEPQPESQPESQPEPQSEPQLSLIHI